MQISPFLWFDNQAQEAADFYVSAFKYSKIQDVSYNSDEAVEVPERREEAVMSVTFEIEGKTFIALNGGPYFTFTPAISFFVNCDTQSQLNRLWEKLSQGGKVFMELNKYPFSERFGWVEDKFGISWQLNLSSSIYKITPFLMFVGAQKGKAEEAMNFYISLFNNSSVLQLERYGPGEDEVEGTVKHSTFSLDAQEFMALDSSAEHAFTFSEAISFFVDCDTQDEVDTLWEELSKGGEKGQCGWIKDKYGVSWQIVPTILGELLGDPDPVKAQRAMGAMLKMSKLNIEELKKAYRES